MHNDRHIRILFVCLGNICRSPLAQGIFQRLVDRRGLTDVIDIDSAGTGDWHIGELPDGRMRQTAGKHGLSLDHLRGRQAGAGDLERFDLILAMDNSNYRAMLSWDGAEKRRHKIRRFREFDPEQGDLDVPDPYWSGADGFELVYRIVNRTAEALLDWIVQEYEVAAS